MGSFVKGSVCTRPCESEIFAALKICSMSSVQYMVLLSEIR